MNLKLIYCKVLEQELRYCAARSRNRIEFQFMEQGLHNTPDILRSDLQAQLDTPQDQCDAVLLGYGLCGNGVAGLSCSIPLVIPRSHDCISLLLGSAKRHEKYTKAHPGCYFFSPGWIEEGKLPSREYDQQLLKEYIEKYGQDNAKYLMETEKTWRKEYHRAIYIDWHLPNSKKYQKYTQKCAEYLGWEYERLDGDPSLLQRMINGQWDEKEFLVLKPNQKIPDHFILPAEGTCGPFGTH